MAINWKGLIFADSSGEGESEKKITNLDEVQTSFKNKFPSTGPIQENIATVAPVVKTKQTITPNNPSCAPHLEKIMAMYEGGFENLNMEGFDFFEYFKMVIEGGVNESKTFTMAFNMAKAMGATKEKLIEESNFYINEIKKVHVDYVNAGDKKRQEAISAKTTEETSLKTELIGIDSELQRLSDLKKQKEAILKDIDNKYEPQIVEIECKLMANDMAMEGIIGSIQKVVTGINNNI